jgi:hypothetical protein
MLTISKPLSTGQAQTCQQQEFTAKEQNHWSPRGVIAGEWQGRPAGQFGLVGTVSARTSRNSDGAGIHSRASSLCAHERGMHSRMPTARQSDIKTTETR